MKHFILLVFIPACLFFSSEVKSQNRVAVYDTISEEISPSELRILAWNIQMLPRFLFRLSRGPIRRSKLIPQKVIDDQIDILVFQEAFDARSRRILKRRLKDDYPYICGPANKKFFDFKTNSGVMIFSKVPLKYLDEIDFKDCESDDCLARKGALLVEAEWQGVTFQVLGTHLEAGGPFAIKETQYAEIRALIDKYQKQGVPQFLCGDFNTSKSSERYNIMLEAMAAEDDIILSDLQYTADEIMNDMNYCEKDDPSCEVIDYILFRENGFRPRMMERYVRQYEQRWSDQYKDLSDHNAVLMRILFH